MTTKQRKELNKMDTKQRYIEIKKMMHTCSPTEYNGLKTLMNYYYNKLN